MQQPWINVETQFKDQFILQMSKDIFVHLVISQLMAAAFQRGTQLNDSVATLALRTDVVGYMSTVSHAVCNLISNIY